ncbi:MAG: cyclopropane-fatty-acyl-phospholipid synthase family protein [Bacteroidales bacterium]
MKKPKEKFKKDRALRFYNEVLGLDRLHYGLWHDSDERNINGLIQAQKRYEELLVDEIENLSDKDSGFSVLDVGCGTGATSETLFGKNYQVEGLSPDLYQKELFEKRVPVPFHLARYQNFDSEKTYDLVLMSESAQYIPLNRLFDKTTQLLKSKGYLVVCDYFVLDDATGKMAKSGHRLSAFLEEAQKNNFQIVKEEDITEAILPTLDTAKNFVERYIIPSLDIAREKIQERRPWLYKTLMWLFRKKISKVHEDMILIDSSEFRKNKRYILFVFSKNEVLL